jgi:hypothetical protein
MSYSSSARKEPRQRATVTGYQLSAVGYQRS